MRDKVIFCGVAEIGETGGAANGSFATSPTRAPASNPADAVNLPREQISLRIARKRRSFLAKVMWWRDNFVGLAFSGEPPAAPVSDLEERLASRIAEAAAQRRINELLGDADQSLSVPTQSEQELSILYLTRFLDANRNPLRWKTLYSAASLAAGGGDHATARLRPCSLAWYSA